MARRVKSLHFNLKNGENVVFHHEHRSKRGRNRINRDNREIFYKKIREKEEMKWGVDKESLRNIRRRYNI